MGGHLLWGDVCGNGDLFCPGRDLEQTSLERGPGMEESLPWGLSPTTGGELSTGLSPPRGTPRPPATGLATSSPPGLCRAARSAQRPRSGSPDSRQVRSQPPQPRLPTPAWQPTLAQQQDAHVPLHGGRPEIQPEACPILCLRFTP